MYSIENYDNIMITLFEIFLNEFVNWDGLIIYYKVYIDYSYDKFNCAIKKLGLEDLQYDKNFKLKKIIYIYVFGEFFTIEYNDRLQKNKFGGEIHLTETEVSAYKYNL